MVMKRRIGTTETARGVLRKTYYRMASDLGAPLRSFNLRTAKIAPFHIMPPPLYIGDVEQGLKILDGRFTLGSQSIDVGANGDPWSNAAPSEPFAYRLHGFGWLDDLAALQNDRKSNKTNPDLPRIVSTRATHLVDRWVEIYGHWNAYAWDNDILANRLFAWFSNWQVLLNGDVDRPQAQIRRTNMFRQLKRLRNTYSRTPVGLARLKAAACLVLGGAMQDNVKSTLLDRGLDLLDEEIEKQILSDGGHVSRNPEQALQALYILRITENTLEAAELPGSREIRRALDRIAPMIAFFGAGKSGLFNFNGGGEGSPQMLAKLCPKTSAKRFGFAPHTKYQRIERGSSVVMIDAGGPPPRPYDTQAHLAPLAIEIVTSGGRLVVNCGWDERQPRDWRQPMRTTAAHSTLILAEENAGKFLGNGLAAQVLGDAILWGGGPVSCLRKDQDAGVWLEAAHEAYHRSFGLSHRRRIYMDNQGGDIRGEDCLFVPAGAAPLLRDEIPFAIRFHLHPDVKVTLAQDAQSALLIQPGGKGWRFRTDGGPLSVEKSVYLARGNRPRRSEQLVVRGAADGDGDGQTRSNRVRWSFIRMGEQ